MKTGKRGIFVKREEILQRIRGRQIIAIVRGVDAEDCVSLAEALYRGGIDLMEITFDQRRPESWITTAHTIYRVAAAMAGRMEVGAGTVCTTEQADLAYRGGAKYIISPDADPAVIAHTRARGMVSIPGALTPSEIKRSYTAGADLVKVFPASAVGAAFFKAVHAPLGHIPLLAVGGIHEKNLGEYLNAGAAGIGVGGNLVNRQWIQEGAFDQITAAAQAYRCAVGTVKGE